MGYTNFPQNESTIDKIIAACDKIPSYIPIGGLGAFMLFGSIMAMFN